MRKVFTHAIMNGITLIALGTGILAISFNPQQINRIFFTAFGIIFLIIGLVAIFFPKLSE